MAQMRAYNYPDGELDPILPKVIPLLKAFQKVDVCYITMTLQQAHKGLFAKIRPH